MEEMRITLKIEGKGKKFKISGRMSEIRAIECFEKLYSEIRGLNELHKDVENSLFNLPYGKQCTAEIEDDDKEEGYIKSLYANKEEGHIKSLYAKVFDFIDKKGPVSTKEIAEALEKDTILISAYVSKLKKEGKIVNTQGSKRLYVSSNFKVRETKEYGALEKLIRSDRTAYIIDYILRKSEVKVDDIRLYAERRSTYDLELVTDIIKILDEYELIYWDNEKEEYTIPDTTKIWYYSIKEGEITYIDLSHRLGKMINSDDFENPLREATEKGLVQINNDYKVYAILK